MSETTAGAVTLYRAWDVDDGLLYIGQTSNLKKRQAEHRRSSEWFARAVRWTTEEYPDREAALVAEAAAIAAERPEFNIGGQPPRPPTAEELAAAEARVNEWVEAQLANAPPLSAHQRNVIRNALAEPAEVSR